MKIPFNLHNAIDGKPVINGMGEDFSFHGYFPGLDYPVVGHFGSIHFKYTKNGHLHLNKPSEMEDLFMKPEKITRWILVNSVVGFDTKEKALSFYKHNIENNFSLIKIEFYPGENLE